MGRKTILVNVRLSEAEWLCLWRYSAGEIDGAEVERVHEEIESADGVPARNGEQ